MKAFLWKKSSGWALEIERDGVITSRWWVASKCEARRIAAEFGAEPWNF